MSIKENNDQEQDNTEPNKPSKESVLNIDCSDDIAQGLYANLVMSNFNKEEFLLDFIFIQPGGKKGKVRSRVILSPNIHFCHVKNYHCHQQCLNPFQVQGFRQWMVLISFQETQITLHRQFLSLQINS